MQLRPSWCRHLQELHRPLQYSVKTFRNIKGK
jgi:hypothetical protein